MAQKVGEERFTTLFLPLLMVENYLKSFVVYEATITTEDNMPAQTNVELTETPFKQNFLTTNLVLTTPTRGSVKSSVSMFVHFAGSRVII